MYPWIAPAATGLLPVGRRHEVSWETSGNPEGSAVLHLHGGPGSGLGSGSYRSWSDPARSWMVGLDQRGCGRSRPLATDPGYDLAQQTTPDLVADLEALRDHLGIARWLVVGLSWGSTLALAYAEAHPARVTGLVLGAVGTTSRDSVEWTTEQMRRVFPREWDAFSAAVPRERNERVVDAYARALRSPDPDRRDATALAWCRWEDTHMSFDPNWQPHLAAKDPDFRRLFATLVTHYWSNSAFGGDEIEDRLGRITHLPAVLIHGRLDISAPLEVPWRLHRVWPGSRLVVLDEGHGGPQMINEVVAAIATLTP